jgi:crotonobetainyl-CoA:carnitine CoA-transferase CaiB-like acyl-CoA transferase
MKDNEYWTAPRLGEDTDTILSDLGMDVATIQKLRRD